MNTELQDYLNGICCPQPTSYNFDITADWLQLGVTDETSFISWATALGYTDIILTDFTLVSSNLKCNLTATNPELLLGFPNFIEIKGYGNIIGYEYISIDGFLGTTLDIPVLNSGTVSFNIQQCINISNISSNFILPDSIIQINLSKNALNLSDYANLETWANAQPIFTNLCQAIFTENTDNISGTNLEMILISKNCTVIP